MKFPAVVNNTIRNAFLSCPTKAMYAHCCGYRLPEPNVDLHAGASFASGLEAARLAFWQGGCTAQESVDRGVAKLLEAYGTFISPTPTNKTAQRMAGALEYYFQQYPLEQEEIIPLKDAQGNCSVESGFKFGLGLEHPDTHEELMYAGRFDMMGQDRNGMTWLVDEKTTGKLGDSWYSQWALDSQMTGYLYAAKSLQVLYPSIDVDRLNAQVRGIAITKTGYGHAAIDVVRPQWVLDRWYAQARDDFARMIHAYQFAKWDMALNKSCNDYGRPCDYTKLCLSSNPERLTSEYEIVHWNPLERKVL